MSFTAEVKIRQYFATQHLWSARPFARVCGVLEDALSANGNDTPNFRHRSLAIGPVFSAGAFLGAFVNEVLQDAAVGCNIQWVFERQG